MIEDKDFIEFWSGQLFELQTADRESFFTQIIKVETNFYIQQPVNKDNIQMPLTNNDIPITVYFHDDLRGLCTFESNIRLQRNRLAIINKPYQSSIKKAQRRRFFRVQVAVDLCLIHPSKEKSNEIKNTIFLTHDISGGGFSFLCPYKVVEKGALVEGILQMKTKDFQKKVKFHGKIVNVIKQEGHFFRFSLEFIQMKESVRSYIIKFCMLKQIELRNKLKVLQ
ncbi:hypothetical protein GN156_07490 [bacterium LRH843]|nr:hypothetical protein [bacterium LRH843]